MEYSKLIFQFESSRAVNIGVEVSEDCKNGCVPWPEPEVNGHLCIDAELG